MNLYVGDPWDFMEEHGEGPLPCKVLQVGYDYWVLAQNNQKEEALLLQLENPVVFEGTSCEYFVAGPRHVGDSVSKLVDGSAVYCGLARIPEDKATSSDPFDLSWWRGGVGLIGTLRRAN